MKKRIIVCLLCALMLLVSVAAAEETLVIYSERNERLNNIVIPAFEEATGIKVEMITGSSGEVLQCVKAEVEAGKVTVDIHWGRTKPCWRPTGICLKCTSLRRTTRSCRHSRMTAPTASIMLMPSRT